MAQLVVNVEEGFPILSLKKAISLLRGVTTVCEKKDSVSADKRLTLKAMADAKAGNTVKFNFLRTILITLKNEIRTGSHSDLF